MSGSIPLLAEHVAAARGLKRWLPQSTAADEALHALQSAIPGFAKDAVLLKVVALNALHACGVHAAHAMTAHILKVFGSCDPARAGTETVDEIARLPATNRHHLTFASKFAHFFIDPARFHVFEGYAVTMLRHHLQRTTLVIDNHNPYWAFTENISTLATVSGVNAAPRDLDAYFWIASAFRAWQQDKTSVINQDLRQLFQTPRPEVARDLAVLAAILV
jgi:hypothetical protein